VQLPAPVDSVDTTPQTDTTPETYLSVGKVVNYGGSGRYDQGAGDFDYPPSLPDDRFALRGRWTLDYQGATSGGNGSSIALNYHAKDVYIVAGGEGTFTVTRDGKTTTVPISGPPTLHRIVAHDATQKDRLEVRVPEGIQVFSFTYG
jgi:Thioredoxin like C-terminal domain